MSDISNALGVKEQHGYCTLLHDSNWSDASIWGPIALRCVLSLHLLTPYPPHPHLRCRALGCQSCQHLSAWCSSD